MNRHTNNNYNYKPICNFHGDSSLLLTSDPKPRLRWTTELHEKFVDAVTQLGGPEIATPKNIMKIMGVKGLTLFHLKSHLQKFRLGKQAQFKDFNEQASRHSEKDFQRDAVTTAGIIASCSLSESIHQSEALRKQMGVRRRLDVHFEVQERLQMRIDAQRKYMQTMLEKACHTICEENVNSHSHSFHGNDKELQGVSNMKDFSSVANFPSTEELNIDGGPCLLEEDHAFKVLNDDQLQIESLIFDGNENLIRFMPGNSRNDSGFS